GIGPRSSTPCIKAVKNVTTTNCSRGSPTNRMTMCCSSAGMTTPQATQSLPIEAHVDQAWYMALHPMKLKASHSPEPYEQLFPDLRSKPRAEQKRKPTNRGGRSSTDHGGGERRLGTMR